MQSNANEIMSRIATKEIDEPWAIPILFDHATLPVIESAWLPHPLNAFAKALSMATETDESMSVMVILGVLSTCLSKYVVVSPKLGWTEPVNIYTLIALPPANHKSLIIRSCSAPLIAWEQQQRLKTETVAKRRLSEIETEKRVLQQMKNKAGHLDDLAEQERLIQEITEREVNMPEPIIIPKLFANDATPESLATHVAEQGGRFAIISDEGGIFDTLAGLYNNGNANIDIVLKGIDGGYLRIVRKAACYDVQPYLTFVMCTQPQLIQNMAAKNAFVGKGFLERFLYVIPKSHLGFRSHDVPGVGLNIQAAYETHIARLIASTELLTEKEAPEVLHLSSEAMRLWQQFQQDTEKQLKPQGDLSVCLGWGGKIVGFTLRIAGLLEATSDNLLSKVVSESSMANAIKIAEALKQHALAAFELMAIDEVTQDAKSLFQLIQHKGLSRFTKTEINRLVKQRKMGRSERLNRALTELIERQILRGYMDHSTLRPTQYFVTNPLILMEPVT